MTAVVDTFDRADSTLTLGTPWTAVGGTWGISGGKAYSPVLGDSTFWPGPASHATVETNQADMAVRCKVVTDPPTSQDMGVAARYVDKQNFWTAFIARNGAGTVTNFYAGKVVASSVTYNIASAIPVTSPGPWIIELVCRGGSIAAYCNGVCMGAIYDTALPSGTKAGIWTTTVSTTAALDDFGVSPPIAEARGGDLLRQILLDSPYLVYPMQELVPGSGSGNTALDYSGNGRHGTYDAAMGVGLPGPGGALAAKAPSAGIAVYSPSSIAPGDTTDYTFEALVQILGTAYGGGAHTVWSQYYNSFGSRTVGYIDGSGNMGQAIGSSSVNATGGQVTSNAWHHVAWRRTSGTLDMFVDGVLVATGSLNFACDSKPTWFAGMSQTGTTGSLNGLVAYCAAWRSALSTARIQAHAKAALRMGASV